MKYKIKHWKCFCATLKDTLECWANILNNDFLGVLFGNVLFYLTMIIGFPIFLILATIWYVKRVKLINRALPSDEIAIRSMIKQGYVKKLDKDKIHIVERKETIKKQNTKILQDERSKKLFNYGDILYTVQGKSQVIKFIVDKVKFRAYKGKGVILIGIREYWCNCYKHLLPYSNNFGNWRCRHNHNLFRTEQEAYAYLDELKQGDK